jgi:hypothetical protein
MVSSRSQRRTSKAFPIELPDYCQTNKSTNAGSATSKTRENPWRLSKVRFSLAQLRSGQHRPQRHEPDSNIYSALRFRHPGQ